jgi:hypothetical protein
LGDLKTFTTGLGAFLGLLLPFLAHEVRMSHAYLLSQEWGQKTPKRTQAGGITLLIINKGM